MYWVMCIRRYGRISAGRNEEWNLQKKEDSESKIMKKNNRRRRGEIFLTCETRIRAMSEIKHWRAQSLSMIAVSRFDWTSMLNLPTPFKKKKWIFTFNFSGLFTYNNFILYRKNIEHRLRKLSKSLFTYHFISFYVQHY